MFAPVIVMETFLPRTSSGVSYCSGQSSCPGAFGEGVRLFHQHRHGAFDVVLGDEKKIVEAMPHYLLGQFIADRGCRPFHPSLHRSGH